MITKTDFDAKLSSLNRKITQNKSKHLLVENELNTVKNKIPDISSLVKKTDHNNKIREIDTTVSNLDGKIDKNIIDIVNVIALLTAENILFYRGDSIQAYLIFQPVCKYFKFITGTIISWKSKGLSDQSIKSPTTSDNSLTPLIIYYDYKIKQ